MKRIYFIFLFSFLAVVILGLERKEDYMQERLKMVEEQIASRGIKDERVLGAMRKDLWIKKVDLNLAYIRLN